MGKVLIVALIWLVGILCIVIMKRTEPTNKIYPLWALFIAISFTLFAVCDW